MKKLLAILLSTAMVLSLTACGGGEEAKTPEQIYTEALEKTAALEAQQAEAKMDMTMEMGGMTLGITMDMDMKMKGKGEATEMQVGASTEILGQAMDIDYYYKDGVFYMNAMGQTGKMTLSPEEAAAQAGADINSATDLSLMESFEMVENEDGTRTFNYAIKQESMQSILAAAMEENAADELLAGSDVKFNSMTGSTVISADGYVLSESMTADLEMTVEDQAIGAVVAVEVTYIEPGVDFTIEYPADLDTYPEIDLTAAAWRYCTTAA